MIAKAVYPRSFPLCGRPDISWPGTSGWWADCRNARVYRLRGQRRCNTHQGSDQSAKCEVDGRQSVCLSATSVRQATVPVHGFESSISSCTRLSCPGERPQITGRHRWPRLRALALDCPAGFVRDRHAMFGIEQTQQQTVSSCRLSSTLPPNLGPAMSGAPGNRRSVGWGHS